MSSFFSKLAIFLIGIYRLIGTTHFGGCCRFEPSCSAYAVQCYKNLGPVKATVFVFKRVLSCRPGGPCGYDPAPVSKEKQSAAK